MEIHAFLSSKQVGRRSGKLEILISHLLDFLVFVTFSFSRIHSICYMKMLLLQNDLLRCLIISYKPGSRGRNETFYS